MLDLSVCPIWTHKLLKSLKHDYCSIVDPNPGQIKTRLSIRRPVGLNYNLNTPQKFILLITANFTDQRMKIVQNDRPLPCQVIHILQWFSHWFRVAGWEQKLPQNSFSTK